MFSTVYMSTAVDAFDADDLAALLAVSRANNSRRDLTGMLLYNDGRFLQAIEGPEETVRAALATIAADPRHDRVKVLIEEQIETRRFPEWSMGYPKVSGAEAESVPGFSDFLTGGHEGMPASASRATLLLDWFRKH